MSQVIIGEMSCCRSNHNKIHIEIKCDKSNVRFLDFTLELEDFAKLVTGAYVTDIPMTVDHLDRVGLTKVIESRKVHYPKGRASNREDQENFLMNECKEEGWIVSPYLRSQSSVKYEKGETYLNYSVYKFVSE